MTDTGKGIPADKQAQVFERFNKLDEFAQGTGLGLAICQIIIEHFGGYITLESKEGEGSTFIVTLPSRIIGIRLFFLETQERQYNK